MGLPRCEELPLVEFKPTSEVIPCYSQVKIGATRIWAREKNHFDWWRKNPEKDLYWQKYSQLVIKLAETEVDKYGRVLIPKEVRGKLGLKSGEKLELKVKGPEIVLRIRDPDLEKKVKELADFVEREAPEPFVSEISKGDSKWLSKKYSLRKLGL